MSWSPLLPPAIICTVERFLPTRQALGPASRATHPAAWRGEGEGTSWKLPARPGSKAAAQNKAKQQLQVAVPPANDGLMFDTFSQALRFVVVVSPILAADGAGFFVGGARARPASDPVSQQAAREKSKSCVWCDTRFGSVIHLGFFLQFLIMIRPVKASGSSSLHRYTAVTSVTSVYVAPSWLLITPGTPPSW